MAPMLPCLMALRDDTACAGGYDGIA